MNQTPRAKRRIALALAIALTTGTLATAAPAFAQTEPVPGATATVNTGAVNVRSGPGLQFGSIASLPYGFGVQLVARSSDNVWVLVRLTNGVQGWVNASLLVLSVRVRDLPLNDAAPASPIVPTATVNTAFVNVRQNADPASPVLGTLSNGDTVQLLGRSFDSVWANVRIGDGRTGWIVANALLASVPVRSLAPSDGSVVGPAVPPFGMSGSTGGSAGAPTATVRRHIIQRGETLGSIAQAYNVTVQAIMRANGIYNPDLIYAGTSLIIP
jgi:uncharacterized protein YgiM (DUF1202 family)